VNDIISHLIQINPIGDSKMNKSIVTALIMAILVIINFLVITSKPSYAKSELIEGLTGSHQGVPVCHCPDDAKNCYCNIT